MIPSRQIAAITNDPLTLTGGNPLDFCATAQVAKDPMRRELLTTEHRNADDLDNHLLEAINLETGPEKEIMPTSNCCAVKSTRKDARKKLVR
jgi:hypothetical protein